LSIANVDRSEFDAEIATTASRGKRNRLTRRQDRFGVHLAVWPAIAFLITPTMPVTMAPATPPPTAWHS